MRQAADGQDFRLRLQRELLARGIAPTPAAEQDLILSRRYGSGAGRIASETAGPPAMAAALVRRRSSEAAPAFVLRREGGRPSHERAPLRAGVSALTG
jgi:hypothetical protein